MDFGAVCVMLFRIYQYKNDSLSNETPFLGWFKGYSLFPGLIIPICITCLILPIPELPELEGQVTTKMKIFHKIFVKIFLAIVWIGCLVTVVMSYVAMNTADPKEFLHAFFDSKMYVWAFIGFFVNFVGQGFWWMSWLETQA